MKRAHVVFILLTALAIIATGCAGFLTQPPDQQVESDDPSTAAARARIADAHLLMQAGKYADALAAYRQFLKDFAGTEWAPEAKYSIALAFVAANNSYKDYAAGAAEFDAFLAQYPNDKRAGEAQSWRSSLKLLMDLRKENERLSKTLEKLKKIDVQQEERRSGR